MIAVDTNVLVHAHRGESTWHAEASACLAELAVGGPWGIPWSCVHEFLAVVTHPRIFRPATPAEIALATVRRWLGPMRGIPLSEGDGYLDVLAQVVASSRASGGRIHDARIAATCMLHGVDVLYTADRDFSGFAGLRTRNPLVTR